MKKNRIFIDTNVWFSAFYKEGVCSQLLRLLHASSHEIVISELVLEEIIHTVREKIPGALPFVIEYINTAKPTVVKNPQKELHAQYQSFADKKDVPILIAALEYECTYFITGNIKDFNGEQIVKEHGIKILPPIDFLRLYEGKKIWAEI